MSPRTRRSRRASWPTRLARSYRLILCAAAIVLLGGLVFHLGCGGKQPPAPQPLEGVAPTVRVRVVQDADSVPLSAAAGAEPAWVQVGGADRRLAFPPRTPVPIKLQDGQWKIGADSLGAGGELVLEARPAGSISIEGRRYRGQLRFVPTKGGSFDVVNHLSIDDYLMGVLQAELYPEFQPEAYKAQAVIARTYAIYVSRTTPKGRHWDLHADTRSQAYGGIGSESAKAKSAVEATRGLVAAYGPPGNAKIFKAYYSSCCGGTTASAQEVFGEPVFEPFTPKSVGRRCDTTAGRYKSQFDWDPVSVGKDELVRRFTLWGRRNGHELRGVQGIRAIDVFQRNPAGRPSSYSIEDNRGAKFVITAEQLRLATNTDAGEQSKLLSGFVKPVVQGQTVRFTEGHGFGHGVGACQWCLEAQAKQGIGFEQIVKDAYKGAVVMKAY